MTTDAEFRQHRSHPAVAAAIAAHPEPYDDSFTGQSSAIAAVRRFAFADGFDTGRTITSYQFDVAAQAFYEHPEDLALNEQGNRREKLRAALGALGITVLS